MSKAKSKNNSNKVSNAKTKAKQIVKPPPDESELSEANQFSETDIVSGSPEISKINEVDDSDLSEEYDSDSATKRKRRGRPRKNQIIQIPIKGKSDGASNKKANKRKNDEELILHLPITMSDVNKRRNNPSEISETVTVSQTNKSVHNIFTITDISCCTSSEDSDNSENYGLKEYKDKIKALEKTIDDLRKENKQFKTMLDSEDKATYMDKQGFKMKVDFISIVDGKQIFLEKTDVSCWWCSYNFDCMPSVIPEKYSDDTYHVFGCFCSYNCASAYNLSLNDYKVWERYSLIKMLYFKIYNKDVEIVVAPQRECLKKFGGIMTIEEFRRSSLKNDKEYRVVMPPMKSIVPIIEESSKNSMIFKGIKAANNSLNNEGLVLQRNKPLPNNSNMIFDKFGMVPATKKVK
jgi:hypothetical protein